MNRLFAAAWAFFLGEEGHSLVEYALLLVFVGVLCLTAITAFGTEISSAFSVFAGTI